MTREDHHRRLEGLSDTWTRNSDPTTWDAVVEEDTTCQGVESVLHSAEEEARVESLFELVVGCAVPLEGNWRASNEYWGEHCRRG